MKNQTFKQFCLAMLSITLITGIWLTSMPDGNDHELEQKEKYREGHQTGVEKQLMTWLWQKGYPEPDKSYQKILGWVGTV